MWPVATRNCRVSMANSPSVPTIVGSGYSLSSNFSKAVLAMVYGAKSNLRRWQRKVWLRGHESAEISPGATGVRETDAARAVHRQRRSSGGRRQCRKVAVDAQPL